MRHLPEFLGS